MIKDTLINANKYYTLGSSIERGLKFLQENNLEDFSVGRYQIDENIYVNIDEYETRISNNIEAHRQYIDIQYIIHGQECIGVTSLSNLKIIEEYNPEKDIIFYNGESNLIPIKKGEFMILYPNDAHLPCQILDKKTKIKKAVVKIKIK